ncbi:hypothetical protein CASFOL_035170 [Castilleja foliolosa]|uniref:Protein kinase domain-containing protein n=1 Tax=Castilleja foliolosa TaxID=1961234 RepID=A0ABD3BS19_9LAMI
MLYIILGLYFISLLGCVNCITDENDLKILSDLKNHLQNPELLKWPDDLKDPCGPPSLPHLFCSNGKVTQIQVQGLGLEGPLPQNFNQLDKLQNLGLQRNKFNGALPSFSGLSNLELAFLDFNEFDTIPSDFFRGLSSVRVLALDDNPFNQSSGWALPSDLAECTQLVNLSCSGCNINGPLPDYLGKLPSLSSLQLSYNRLSGNIPSTFRGSMLQSLWLNNQDKVGMTGPINIIGSMLGLTSLWLHGNHFTGSIPDDIGLLTSLKQLNLNGNRLVGLIPPGLANLNLQTLDLNNNMLMGPIPKFKAVHATYQSNSFCTSVAGEKCAPEVGALLDFLHDLNYPETLASGWRGNDPCDGPWWGISCNPRKEVTVINLQRLGLNGTLSPSLANLPSLHEIHLEGNNLHGPVPENLTHLASLRVLNLNGNNFDPPLPIFRPDVRIVTDGNPKFQSNGSESTNPSPRESPDSSHNYPSPGQDHQHGPKNSSRSTDEPGPKNSRFYIISAAVAGSTVFALIAIVFAVFCVRKKKMAKTPPARVSNHSSKDNMFIDSLRASNAESLASYGFDKSQSIKPENANGNSLISLHVLRKVTGDFAKENELGRGGFGVVYRGELDDGSEIAVKRMVVGAVCNTALHEFRSEIGVLSSVRHRNLVSLLGYSEEGDERLLVYEYMPRGALSRHLFRWKSLGLEPLTWTRRINIALDVARGVEYLHKLAHHSFVHRDLKSANILLDDGFRAKVADFGLVKLAPDREVSVATRLAGTFGYLAPEYAVTGKITTKVDVFSFGVVLMELLTGLSALDEQRPEEKRYLAEWFWRIKSSKETLIAAIDPALEAKEDIYDTICDIALLAGHCTARDPTHRPEMGHAVNVLGQLVEKWRPFEETDEYISGINMTLPLPQMLKGWQEEEGETRDISYVSQDSKGSIPAKPSGFADSFTSNDAR